MNHRWVLPGLLLAAAACGDDASPTPDADGGDADVPEAPEDGDAEAGDEGDGDGGPPTTFWTCPGDPACATTGATAFEVGAGRAVMNPTITETLTVDTDDDNIYDPRDGDEFDDADGDTVFDGVWIAGLDHPRAAAGIHDDIEARAIALRAGDRLLVVVSVDLIGIFYDFVEQLRGNVADLGIDHLVVAASHDHEGPDSIGLWGLDEADCGADPEYLEFVVAQMERAARDAVDDLRPARVRYGSIVPGESAERGVANVVSDTRDPCIINDRMTVLVFEDSADGSNIATLVNWTGHPEFSGDRTDMLSADYVYWLRDGIENGIAEGTTTMPGVGGLALFTQGALGGQVGPGEVTVTGLDGREVRADEEDSPLKAELVGKILGLDALKAIDDASAPEDTIDLAWVRARLELTIENYGYHAMLLTETFIDRELHGYDPSLPLETGNFPRLWTEVSWLKIGRAQAFTVGGEPFPELFIGGYDGSRTPAAYHLLQPGSEYPPDLDAAPGPPYLFDRIDDADFPMAWGLTNDMLGYLMDGYDYVLDDAAPFVEEAPGDHYEETNSIGPSGWPTILEAYEEILGRRPGP